MEGRDVAVMDLPETFLHADNNDEVMMTMKGKLVELMVMVAPQIYQKYIVRNKQDEPVLYMKVQKAIYGIMKSALLFKKITT